MKVIYNRFIPFKGFVGINICGRLFVRKEYRDRLPVGFYEHEACHTRQMERDGYVYFYVRYLCEYIRGLFQYGNSHTAYRRISYEVEAYNAEN